MPVHINFSVYMISSNRKGNDFFKRLYKSSKFVLKKYVTPVTKVFKLKVLTDSYL